MTGPEGLTGRDGAGGYPHPMSDAAEGRAPTAGPSAAEESTEPDQAWRIGAIAGVPVYLAKSWLVIAALVIYMFAPQVRTVRPADPAISAYLVAAPMPSSCSSPSSSTRSVSYTHLDVYKRQDDIDIGTDPVAEIERARQAPGAPVVDDVGDETARGR